MNKKSSVLNITWPLKMLSPEDKTRIPKRPCNILYFLCVQCQTRHQTCIPRKGHEICILYPRSVLEPQLCGVSAKTRIVHISCDDSTALLYLYRNILVLFCPCFGLSLLLVFCCRLGNFLSAFVSKVFRGFIFMLKWLKNKRYSRVLFILHHVVPLTL